MRLNTLTKSFQATDNRSHTGAGTTSGSVATSSAPQQSQAAQEFGRLVDVIRGLDASVQQMRGEVKTLRTDFQELSAQQGVQQQVFDTLHTEMSDYKNDFVSARMKPMLNTLLFLYDAI